MRTSQRIVWFAFLAGVYTVVVLFLLGWPFCSQTADELSKRCDRLDSQLHAIRDGREDRIVIYGEFANELLSRLRHVSGVRSLLLDCTDVSLTGMRCIRDIPDLRVLEIRAGMSVLDDAMESLGGHEQLVAVALWNTGVTDRGIAALRRLPNLSTITLRWDNAYHAPPLSDKAIEILGEMKALKVLIVSGDWYTAKAVQSLQTMRPDIQVEAKRGHY